MTGSIQSLHSLGQSVWYDNIQRRLLENGTLAELISKGDIRGVTSNPSIFYNAIANSNDYDAALKPMAWSGWDKEKIFWQLAVEDICAAADLFLPLYEQSNRGDGYVSLEVSPYLAHDTLGTIEEAKRLWNWIDRPNLMIKIPATPEGIPAIRRVIASGINVNVTLIFSLARYAEVIDAYFCGLEDRLATGQASINTIASVASFFVSRLDSKVDKALQEMVKNRKDMAPISASLFGKVAIANTCLAYALFKKEFSTDRYQKLKLAGANIQRPLWASTSTKNPAYRDVLYLEELIAPDTVNTVPPQTLDAFRDHGKAMLSLSVKENESCKVFASLEASGVNLEKVTQELENEGVKSFSDAFSDLLDAIENRRSEACFELGPLSEQVALMVKKLDDADTARRLFERSPTLWTDSDAARVEIMNRLGWLQSPTRSLEILPGLDQFVVECQLRGLTNVLLLGMGGSSLAPEVFANIFGTQEINGKPGLFLNILDSTDPDQIEYNARDLDFEKTLFIVSSKSGATSEVNALLTYFWDLASQKLGKNAAQHFIAITDPGSSLEIVAKERKFGHIFSADPSVGGRYSALIAFGLVPAALLGVDIRLLLQRAEWMSKQCAPSIPAARNPGLVLGAIIGEAALLGRDKLTIIADQELASFGSWLEQLIAESSGKDGRGIVPVDLEPLVGRAQYGDDRVFVYLKKSGAHQEAIEAIRALGHPVLIINIPNKYDLGAEFYRWEIATAIACSILNVNAFDQPQVQDNKSRTTQKIADYAKTGVLEEGQLLWSGPDGSVFGAEFPGSGNLKSIRSAVTEFLGLASKGEYVAVQAYLNRSPSNIELLQNFRESILKRTGLATTLGFGPRFLHSTGQLHKGGANNGVFIQITSEPNIDLEIPGLGITFGVLEHAQALGDFESLMARGRRVNRIHLSKGSLSILRDI